MASKLGEMLLKEGVITPSQLEEALEYQRVHGGRLGSILIKLGFATEEQVTSILSRQYGYPYINLSKFEIPPKAKDWIPADIARKYLVVPVDRAGSTLTVAMADPTNLYAIEELRFITGMNIQPAVASESAILEALDRLYGSEHEIQVREEMESIIQEEGILEEEELEMVEEEETLDIHTLSREAEQAPVVRLVNLILTDAIKRGASDIHIEPYEKELRVRYRIDGILHKVMTPPYKMKDAIVSRIKILSRLNIAEKRLPQDGRIKLKVRREDGTKKDVDMRVSIVPTVYGEKVVIRILDRDQLRLNLEELGFEPESLEKFIKAIKKPWGMVLVTGPTGSGKTNTLYSALSTLNTTEVNIMTAEDPVEFNLYGINQVHIREEIGLTFASALRSFLRQDPNIILVGEIRDFETAEIAIKAALTGHLVLSTLHTNDAASAVTRLINMGIEPFLVATSVILIVAQRLVRRLCKKCKQPTEVSPQVLIELGFTPEEAKSVTIYKATGCNECNNTGYKGRIGLFEVLEVTEEIQELILSGASAAEIRRKAIEQGMLTLRRSGLEKIKAGITSIEEVLRETVRF